MEATKTYVENPSGKLAVTVHAPRSLREEEAAAASRLAPIKVGDLRLYPEYRFSSIHEREITLTAKEFDILSLLASNPKRVFTYEMIVDLVWHEDYTFYLSLSRKRQASTACWFSRQKRQNW